ncbi:MAG: serine/threonine-protein kinase, partial [Polyangiaceae bacterium]
MKSLAKVAMRRDHRALNERRLEEAYELVRVIGHGAMGAVYEARDRATGEAVAIKWMHARPRAERDPELLRFAQEARIVGALSSPHLPRVVELSRDPARDVMYLVMELLRGEDLRSLLARVGALRADVAVQIAAQACVGLARAHAAGVVHRDIKPENLFLARPGDGSVVVKVLDFGVAKIRRSADHTGASGGVTAPARSMTASGQIVGTPLFLAPEMLDGEKGADVRSDVYSMGVTL